MEGNEHDVYVAQLREVFDSCDVEDRGHLKVTELRDLCNKLQLEDQTEALIQQLVGDKKDATVGFEEFKEGFVSVLSQAVDNLDVELSEEEDAEEEFKEGDEKDEGHGEKPEKQELEAPKFVHGEKKYGRRSRPDHATDTDADVTTDFSDTDYSFASPAHTPRVRRGKRLASLDSIESNDEQSPPEKKEKSASSGGSPGKQGAVDDKAETFEAEGQMNQAIADMENTLDPVSEEQHLRDIWRDLGVGKSGYLTINELAIVCAHIGMDEMNREELQHLFDKLDVDQDGQVSFEEFLHGLFQHGGSNTPSTPVRPLSTPRQKLRFSVSMTMDDGRTQTPSFVASGVGLFSHLDPEGTGYCRPDAIIEFWDSMGIPQGADILEYLQFDPNAKVNLSDLAYCLEQEMRIVEEDNATYQAAMASYQAELKHTRVSLDHVSGVRDKLKHDLSEANNRIALLVKEGDERHASLERNKERELLAIEKKYQEQLKSLQADLEKEHDVLNHQNSKTRHRLEKEIDKLKEEESRLKERLSHTQEELEKLEKEIMDMAEKCSELEKANFRQSRELESAADLHKKLEEMESNRDIIKDEQQKFAAQKVVQLESDNKELKDKNDELTMEVEDLKQQLSATKRRSKGSKNKDPRDPRRQGSILSDYAKPTIRRRRDSDTSGDVSEDEDSTSTASRPRRKLPKRPSETDSVSDDVKEQVEKLQQELEQEKKDKEASDQDYRKQLQELRQGFDNERKDIEQAFKLEITELEDNSLRERADLIQRHRKEKEDLQAEFEEELQQRLEELEHNINARFSLEKQDMLIKSESAKNLREQTFAEEKLKLTTSLRQEYNEQLENRLKELKNSYNEEREELERRLDRDQSDVDSLKRQKAEMELKLRLQREEMELQFQKEKVALGEKFDQEKAKLEERHRLDILDYENMFTKGVSALKGKLKEDFYALLDRYKEEVLLEEKRKLQDAFEKEKDELIEDFELEKESLHSANIAEKEELEENYKDKMLELEAMLDERTQKYEEEIEHLQQGYVQDRDQLEEDITQELQCRLEEEFVQQIERVKGAFEEERGELEARIQLLQEELDDISNNQRRDDQLRKELDERSKDTESHYMKQLEEVNRVNARLQEEAGASKDAENRYRHQVAELNRANAALKKDKEKAEKRGDELSAQVQEMMEENNNVRRVLEDRIEKLKEQKETIIPLQTSPLMGSAYMNGDSHRDKAILEAIDDQKRLLEDKARELKQQILNIDAVSKNSTTLQRPKKTGPLFPNLSLILGEEKPVIERPAELAHEKLMLEKEALETSLQSLQQEMDSIVDRSQEADHWKAQLENWEVERNLLKDQLRLSSDQMADLNAKLSVSQSEHVREVQRLKDEANGKVDMTKYNNLHVRLVEQEKKMRELEAAMEQRAAETSKMLMATQEDHKRTTKDLQNERNELERKLNKIRSLLDEQVEKLKVQLEKNTKSDLLVKDLYIENAALMKALHITETREKKAEQELYKMGDKYKALQRLFNKICPVALG